MILFHLAFRVDDIASTRRFYGELLGCRQGREAPNWIDFDFFGHQISAHIGPRPESVLMTRVDDEDVPLVHFGAILGWEEWDALARRIAASDNRFVVEPHVRFVAKPGEQGTFFVADPSGNVLEFKAFRHPSAIFDGDDNGLERVA
ncbi:VOC family protein [Sphingomonas nostoxanthinifaciens]|uniref:VOC family protein n=1 Tax=Sphingomonas nostoxanthinifaciens TaxID=2872652 RepID=UPI001CC1FA35|nr:VOC family protein [Sphingomonas nostoxanthinifaciens]UAK23772.1 VOC family protein [Sphingomonas nostoxanthinifaciens]